MQNSQEALARLRFKPEASDDLGNADAGSR